MQAVMKQVHAPATLANMTRRMPHPATTQFGLSAWHAGEATAYPVDIWHEKGLQYTPPGCLLVWRLSVKGRHAAWDVVVAAAGGVGP